MSNTIFKEDFTERMQIEIQTMVVKGIQKARDDAALDKQILKKMEMIKWLGISYKTFSQWEEEGMPVIHMPGATVYSKAQVIQWLESRAI